MRFALVVCQPLVDHLPEAHGRCHTPVSWWLLNSCQREQGQATDSIKMGMCHREREREKARESKSIQMPQHRHLPARACLATLDGYGLCRYHDGENCGLIFHVTFSHHESLLLDRLVPSGLIWTLEVGIHKQAIYPCLSSSLSHQKATAKHLSYAESNRISPKCSLKVEKGDISSYYKQRMHKTLNEDKDLWHNA